MDTGHASVATITLVRSDSEETLLRRSLELLACCDLPVAVADAGQSAAFAQFLRRVPGFSIVNPSEQGLVAQVQASFSVAAAFDTPFILYAEPDKELFFEQRMLPFLRAAPGQGDVGVVLASRSPRTFDTFPPMQRYTEGVINRLAAELIGAAGDYSYGPFLMNRSLLPFLARVDRRVGWGWRHAMFVAARKQGLRVVHVEDDYPCPRDQRCEDDAERLHRMRQLSQNIAGLID